MTEFNEYILFLEGNNINLRFLKDSDLPHLLSLMNDPFIREISSKRLPITESMEKKWLDKAISGDNKNEMHFGITLKNQEKNLLGTICIHSINFIHGTAYMGILMNKFNRGKGYGSEAVKLLLGYAFIHLNLRKILWSSYATNSSSILCAEKCGFSKEAQIISQFRIGDELIDEIILSMFKDIFLLDYKNKRGGE